MHRVTVRESNVQLEAAHSDAYAFKAESPILVERWVSVSLELWDEQELAQKVEATDLPDRGIVGGFPSFVRSFARLQRRQGLVKKMQASALAEDALLGSLQRCDVRGLSVQSGSELQSEPESEPEPEPEPCTRTMS